MSGQLSWIRFFILYQLLKTVIDGSAAVEIRRFFRLHCKSPQQKIVPGEYFRVVFFLARA